MSIDCVSFTATGCIISQAAASMLSEAVVGKSAGEIRTMERADMEKLLGATLSPSRVKCAMLPLIALKNGLAHHAHGS
jgi:nitrogen fixation NifU-like protein